MRDAKPADLQVARDNRRSLTRCPRRLRAEAKREWRRIVPELVRQGLFTVLDRSTVATYCTIFAELQECHEAIRRHGYTYEGPEGEPVARPEVDIADQLSKLLLEYADALGLSPWSRSRIANAQGG